MRLAVLSMMLATMAINAATMAIEPQSANTPAPELQKRITGCTFLWGGHTNDNLGCNCNADGSCTVPRYGNYHCAAGTLCYLTVSGIPAEVECFC